MEKILERFWKSVYRLSKKKFMDAHLKRVGNDIKCHGCNEWFAVSGIEHKHYTEKKADKDFTTVVCGQCGAKSNWSPHIAPVPIRVDDDGVPIST